MFLRSLRIRGFKSFAGKTVLEFGPGLSVIVGPNGSGKSNLADAMAWVLGEQGPRALRGGQMADVIFAGGQGRARLGLAEVSLVIDNTAGLIPVEATELEVSRTIYRSGESEYRIGDRSCRLMDIQELLSDTGIGRELHTVIGQGHLEDVLTARPEDRRRFIEEAAGIAKHRRRKERAERKLSSLEQDLLRLNDVMGELRRQLRPLKQQAEMAERHEKFSDEAESLAWRVAASRLRELYRERDRRRPVWEEGQARRQEAEARLASLDGEIASATQRLSAAEAGFEQAEREHDLALRARSEAEASLREAVRAEGEARATMAAEEGRSGRLISLEEEARRTDEALVSTLESLGERESALEEAERAYQAAEHARREANEERERARDAAAQRRAEMETIRRSLESSESERERLASALEDVRQREARATEEREARGSEVERLDAEETPMAERQSGLGRDRERLEEETRHLLDAERRLDARRQAVEARREALRLTPGRRFLRRARKAVGLLGELIEADQGMEAALAAGLGHMADAVVYLDHGQAVADAPGAPGATLAVEEGAAGGPILPGERTLLSAVRADSRVRNLAESILRDVYLARDPNEALAKHRQNPSASFVTPDGVLVGPAVVRVAASKDTPDLIKEEEAVERDLARVRSQLSGKQARLDQVNEKLAGLAERLEQADARITSAADGMARLEADLAALRRECEVLEERLQRVEETIGRSRGALASVPPEATAAEEHPPAPDPPISLRVEVEALRRERARLETGLARIRGELDERHGADPRNLREQTERAASAREAAEGVLREAEVRATEAERRRDEAARRATEARSQEMTANESWREAAAALQRLRDQYEEEDQARRDVDRRIEEAERVLSQGHAKDPGEAVAALADDDTLESLQKRSNLVARRLGMLGRVNLVAAEEYRSLQERHDFLKREIEDVKAARRDLHQVVREVDRKMEEIFDAAFTDVAAEFASVCEIVFPGGEGKLELIDPDNLLTTGIEIQVRPGRKRVRRLSLLSGGERSLVALAFLFAIFRARPSPFYLLDEVEAALDDVNLHRFLELVRNFAQESQVILITHQKRTMEAADVLYGVSMGGDGVSKVITQRMSELETEAVPASRG